MVPYSGTYMHPKAKTPRKQPGSPRFAMCDPAWLRMELTARELRILLALSLYADWTKTGDGRCYPRRDTLALTTDLEISHVSESVRTLSSTHHLITVVRLGRKNIYYVRAIGETAPMPPSDPVPFFRYLAHRGVRLNLIEGHIVYDPETRLKLDQLSPLHVAIVSDYVRGLTALRLAEAVNANREAKEEYVQI